MTAFADIAVAPAPGDRPTGAQALLFTAAGAAVLAAHAGLVAWALNRPGTPPAPAATPAAVMIELAPAPVAPRAETPMIAPDSVETPEIAAPPPPDRLVPPRETEPAPPPPELAPPRPVEPPAAEAPPPVEPPPDVVPEVVVTRPLARPDDLPRPPRTEPAEPLHADPPVPQQPRLRAALPAPPAETAAARQTSRGQSPAHSPATWQARLLAHLERSKRYPPGARRRGAEGVAYVTFAIDGGGNVLSVALARSSGEPDLDAEVVAMIERASPVPAPPPGAPRQMTAPVQFNLR